MESMIDLNSKRAYEARIAKAIGKTGFRVLSFLGLVNVLAIVGLIATNHINYALILVSLAMLFIIPALWWDKYLSKLPVKGRGLNDRLSPEILANLNPKLSVTCDNLWQSLQDNWQSFFVINHLLLTSAQIEPIIKQAGDQELTTALTLATAIADKVGSEVIEPAFICAGLIYAQPELRELIVKLKNQPEDIIKVASWLGRNMLEYGDKNSQNFGGIGRDWAFGYTPIINRFGDNISQSIIKNNAHFGWLTDSKSVMSIESALVNQAKAIALIGQVGIGKSSNVYAFAQRLIEGRSNNNLSYHQIVLINATDIVSSAKRQGDIEYIMMSLANEASHAGHIILFFDDAEAFFSDKLGSFDATQILQSIIQSRSVQIILALTPNGFETIKSTNTELASLLTPIVLTEFDEASTMHVLEDTAIGLENKNNIMVAYEALLSAYQLSSRYNLDEAYPGKAIKILEQSVNYANHKLVDRHSVEAAIEQIYGSKVGVASQPEAEALLNLEAEIHQRMINQDQAVSVVASALRRARAGIANPNRPVGSFLFLGPTGVGKTELAKALSATYYHDESGMIRLDMSEYQNKEDVNRLLSDGTKQNESLILRVRRKPFSVVLLDEIEKAHPNILNLLLQLLDEGQLSDLSGRSVSFKDSIIIVTSNAGAKSIRKDIELGKEIADFHDDLINQLIKSDQFKPELLNRFDEIVIFRPLKPAELKQIVALMMNEINNILSQQNITVSLSDESLDKIVQAGYDPNFGARPMRRVLQKAVENTVAEKILKKTIKPGDQVTLEASELNL